jgi:4'-phosphopantetheinyl transferase
MSASFSSDRVNIFYGRISEFEPVDSLPVLSDEELARADRYLLPQDKHRYIISKSILKRLISRFLNIEEKNIRIDLTKNGKPFLAGSPDFQFNTSHSDDAFAIGFTSGKEIGIDIENRQRVPNIPALERFLFTTDELKIVQQLEESRKQEVFIESWTRKEALLKSGGEGLTKSMNCLEVSFMQHKQFSLETEDQLHKTEWFLESFTLMNEYLGAVAVKGKINEVCYTRIDRSTF